MLFASKNHKAVDVVEERVNRLGPRPLLLRLGQEYQPRLEADLSSLLSATSTLRTKPTTNAPRDAGAAAGGGRSAAVGIDAVITLRNEVDQLEQACERARNRLGEPVFGKVTAVQLAAWRPVADAFAEAALGATPVGKPLWTRCFWPFLRHARRGRLRAARERARPGAAALGLALLGEPDARCGAATYLEEADQLNDRLRDAETAVNYRRRLVDLRHARTPTAVAADRRVLLEKIVSSSIRLWNAWLRVLPRHILQPARTRLGEFTAVLRILRDAQGEASRDVLKEYKTKYYDLFPHVANYLPAWAVTALSARGQLPLDPGKFDLVVIDEASQCDIASAIPLLYRAKRAVIIGDPKQLRHISRIESSRRQTSRRSTRFTGFAGQLGLSSQFIVRSGQRPGRARGDSNASRSLPL